MTSAALATGNSVVLKPAEQSPATRSGAGRRPPRRRRAAGRARACCPGFGEAGAALVRDPARAPDRVHRLERGRPRDHPRPPPRRPEGQDHVKRVIAEMGGKNCVIVDSDADLDDAVPAIVESAFGYGGQKCSAASRVLAHEAIAETLVERLAGAVETLAVGQADDFATDVPPLIEREARERLERYARRGRASGRVAAGGRDAAGRGLVRAADRGHRPARRLAAAARGGLRAAAHGRGGRRDRRGARRRRRRSRSRSPAACSRAARRRSNGSRSGPPVGNLYVNRSITGAMVAPPAVRRQPPLGHRHTGRRPRLPDASSPSRGWSARTRCATGSSPSRTEPARPAEREAAGR